MEVLRDRGRGASAVRGKRDRRRRGREPGAIRLAGRSGADVRGGLVRRRSRHAPAGLNYPGQVLWGVLPVFIVIVALTAFPFTWLFVGSRGSVLVVAVMHGVLNALSDTFTSTRYLPDGNPLVVGGSGVVGAAILLGVVSAAAAIRWRRKKKTG
jgi:hypothetical protein